MIKKLYYSEITEAIEGAKLYGLACYENAQTKVKIWLEYSQVVKIIYLEKGS